MVIMGIDPGSQTTGYGLIQVDGRTSRVIALGCLTARTGASLSQRLRLIYEGLCGVLEQYRPQEAAVEATFYGRNVKSALVMGQARGVCLLALEQHGCRLFEYSPLEIKKAVVGRGAADKRQVSFMVRAILGLRAQPPLDAADALAAAICHLHKQGLLSRLLREER